MALRGLAATCLALSMLAGAAQPPTAMDARAVARVAAPPLGLPPVPVPAANPVTPAKVALGRKLFFDRRLSRNGTMSCAMCHVPEQGFTQGELATPIGVKGASLPRNAPSLFNVAYLPRLFQDAREESLELQVLGPLFATNEMANPSVGFLLDTLRRAPDYAGLFEAAFGHGPDLAAIGAALASYQRTLLSGGSAFDRWRYGGASAALDAEARRGFELFTGKAGCAGCHLLAEEHALFTDHQLHNTGVGVPGAAAEASTPVVLKPGAAAGNAPPRDLGRMGITDRPADLYAFRTPGLRNVALTAPYMHDGSLRTLEDVVRFYAAGGRPNPALDPRIAPLALDDAEVAALAAFLRSLTGADVGTLVEDARSAPVGN